MRMMFTVRDSKTGAYERPFFDHTKESAIRSFKIAVNKSDLMFAQFAEDYDLYYLGDFDDRSGKLTPVDTPQHIVKAIQLKDISPTTN